MPTEKLVLVQHFCESHNIDVALITEFRNFGLLEIIFEDDIQYLSTENVTTLEKLIRLYLELNINFEGIDVILQLLDRIGQLQQQVIDLQNKVDFLSNVR